MKPLFTAASLLTLGLVALGISSHTQAQDLVEGEHKALVQGHCSACHSLSIVTQSRMSRERWLDTIRWMQDTQGLWPLGDAEDKILDYLSTYYAPTHFGRRPPLAEHLLPTPK